MTVTIELDFLDIGIVKIRTMGCKRMALAACSAWSTHKVVDT